MSLDVSRPEHTAPLRWLATRVRALRAFSLPVSVLPVLAAAAAVRTLTQWHWDVLIASALGAALLHAAGNLLNDYFDFLSGVDQRVAGDEDRPGRLLVRGELTPRDVLAEAGVCLLLAVPVVVYLVWTCGPGLLWFGGAALFAIYAYTGPPLRLKYRALGELLIFFIFGPLLMTGAAYAQTGSFEWSVLLLSISVGLATTSILVGNNLRDREEDADAGIATVAQVMGPRTVRVLYIVLVASSALGLALLAGLRQAPLALLAAPAFLILILKPLAAVWRGERLSDVDVQTARFETVLLLFLVAVLILHGGTKPIP